MEQPAERQRLFSIERWGASSDLRTDIAHIVVAIAILAGIATLDPDTKSQGATETSLSVAR